MRKTMGLIVAVGLLLAGCTNEYMAPGGSDAGNNCRDPAKPCRTQQHALDQAATSGGTLVHMAAGNYPAEELHGGPAGSVTDFKADTPLAVHFIGREYLNGTNNVTQDGIAYERTDGNWDLQLECNRNVQIANSTGHRMTILDGNAAPHIIGGSWGGYTAPGTEDSGLNTHGAYGPERNCNPADGTGYNTDVLIKGVTFHDAHWGQSQAQWGGAHPDCFQIDGNAKRVTFDGDLFVRCGNSFMMITPDQGKLFDLTIENSSFQQLGDQSYYGIQYTNGNPDSGGGGFVFKNNVYSPENPGGLYSFSGLRLDFRADTGQPTHAVVSGNQFYADQKACNTDVVAWSVNTWHSFGAPARAGGECP